MGIVGEAGSGKSVLLDCLLGLRQPDSGSIELLGKAAGPALLPVEGLGVALQKPGLVDGWSVAENLWRASPDLRSPSHLRTLLDEVGLDELTSPESAAPSTLSGGQQKRVALLRALARGRDLLVLDEPSSGLDPVNARRVTAVLRQRTGPGKAALLLISHDYEEVVALSDRVLILSGGHLRPAAALSTTASALRQEVSELPGALDPEVSRSSAPRLSTLSAAWDFLSRGLLLTVPTMALLGAVLVLQSAGFGPIDTSRLVPALVATAVFRELAPLVVGLVLGSRIASKVCSEVGGMSYTAQLVTLRVLGLSARRLLLLPYSIAAAVVVPATILAGAVAAVLGGAWLANTGWSRLSIGYTRFLDISLQVDLALLVPACILKGTLMGLVVVAIAYASGRRPISDARSLGAAVTFATVWSAVAVSFVDLAVSSIFFSGGRL